MKPIINWVIVTENSSSPSGARHASRKRMSPLLIINHSLETSGLFHYHFVQSVEQIGPSPSTSQFDLGFPYLLRNLDNHWISLNAAPPDVTLSGSVVSCYLLLSCVTLSLHSVAGKCLQVNISAEETILTAASRWALSS